jgi:hypothetical protein
LGTMTEFRKHWFVTLLCTVAALIFLASLILSGINYIRIIDARENAVLADAEESVELAPSGILYIGFSVELRNPSKVDLSVSAVSWSVNVDISIMGGSRFLPLVTIYNSSAEMLLIEAGTTRVFEYHEGISDPTLISQLRNYINASAAQGDTYTFESIPYIHDFRMTAWIEDLKHDYDYSGESYLNEMVRLERRYYDGDYL